MERIIYRKGKKIAYKISGSGKIIVLLHGYLESLEVWNDFAFELAKDFKVICIDLPGFGKSDALDLYAPMEAMADSVNAVFDCEDIVDCTLVGHSMGGYVTLSFAERFADTINGFVLFHSTPYADNTEKIENRKREIELVEQGKKHTIISINIPKTFADENVSDFDKEIDKLKFIAKKTTDDGIVGALKGMIQRIDKQHIIKLFKKPMLIIAGAKDNYIPIEASRSISLLSEKIELEILENSGHIGFVEEKEKSLAILKNFISDKL